MHVSSAPSSIISLLQMTTIAYWLHCLIRWVVGGGGSRRRRGGGGVG